MAKLIFGCGYLGTRVARRWRETGEQVFVVTRSPQRAAQLAAIGLTPWVADVLRPESLGDLPRAETVLYAIGYDRTSGVSREQLYVGGLRAALSALPADTGRLIYVSSTGVYGQADGGWVDEESNCEPTREGGRACLAAENLLNAHPLGQRAIVLRMAGLYGPGRVPNMADIRAGRPIAVAADGYLNLIHVDDAAGIVLTAEQRAAPPRTYLVSDGHAVERRAYYQELAKLLGAPPPQVRRAPADSPAAKRAAGDKRIRNARLLAELGVTLRYPSYRQGLAAILRAENIETD